MKRKPEVQASLTSSFDNERGVPTTISISVADGKGMDRAGDVILGVTHGGHTWNTTFSPQEWDRLRSMITRLTPTPKRTPSNQE